mmetsp:Transcript_11274/g.24423  ORF Transcript_11274/g.24423 Transcript_11274/m.24423 type:complete len:460 (+) Transcript_11274:142-1521(+)|eukprot:CAMPEP_0172531314 /NCGR_PEP_ID=MMETSP1067-20121228/4774_1 /TAXON_ID=265564 ORGANISM="Thalassiosira punctigera, Strain Tpunct2005C2" /NCGR_SAMPLE_ID=MMETSP1067 /ASSEMBLY_ACC=CAM_ASM_000444 /LENGTH=459 /DNA_ID=CAMNT_0013315679 /DNA_START=174 /DNA_END=1553 /DNA_ORIENTATION=-
MLFFFCLRPTIHFSAIAAFGVANKKLQIKLPRLHQVHTISELGVPAQSLSKSSNSNQPIRGANPPPSSPGQDWFSDGREAARHLKLELGILIQEGDDDRNTTPKIDGLEEIKFTKRNSMLDSGRAAARELLIEMKMDVSGNEVGDRTKGNNIIENPSSQLPTSSGDELQTTSTESNRLFSSSQSPRDCFDLPSRKSHCMTVCLVPPPSATEAWEQLTAVRKECKDPEFFRWAPHANILYPFLEPVYHKESEEGRDVQFSRFRNEVAIHLAKAAEKCNPFDVTIDSFGTFGGKQRGVLWAYPRSKYTQPCDDEVEEEPLLNLQSLLEHQFPSCRDRRKAGSFHPHITVSHYPNNDMALTVKEEVQSQWKPVSFHVPEIYLLEREGDGGQFEVAASIPLGRGSQVEFHDPSVAFPAMPEIEEEWVLAERMSMKERRKDGFKRRKRIGGKQMKSFARDTRKK